MQIEEATQKETILGGIYAWTVVQLQTKNDRNGGDYTLSGLHTEGVIQRRDYTSGTAYRRDQTYKKRYL